MVRARAAKEALSSSDSTVIDAVLTSGEIVHLTLDADTFIRSPPTWCRRR
jgi:molecular chaperone HscA